MKKRARSQPGVRGSFKRWPQHPGRSRLLIACAPTERERDDRHAGRGDGQEYPIAHGPRVTTQQDAARPGSGGEEPVVIRDPGDVGRIDDLNHRAGGADRPEDSEVAALGVLDECDGGAIQCPVSLRETYPFEVQTERPRR